MHAASLRSLPDDLLLARLRELVRADRLRCTELLLHLGELDRRRLYRDVGYSSMYEYCRGHLAMSEDEAYRRIRVARLARRCPVVLECIEDGRLTLSSAYLLAPYLTSENHRELLRASEGCSNQQVRELLAARFPRPDVPTVLMALHALAVSSREPVNALQGELVSKPVGEHQEVATPAQSDAIAAERPEHVVKPIAPFPSVAPLSPASYALQCTLSAAAHAKLREIQDLLGPRVPSSEISRVLELALDALLVHLEKSRKAALLEPEADQKVPPTATAELAEEAKSQDTRHIPASVRRAVWARDAGSCQFVSATGHRCGTRSGLEIDHVQPVSLGGGNTLANLRLLCRAHNQLEAERRLGQGMMQVHRARLRRVVPTA